MAFSLQRFSWRLFYAVHWVIILLFWWRGTGDLFLINATSSNVVIALGRLAGLAATYLILVQFFLMGRFPLLERVFGLDRLSRMHHTSGVRGFFLLLLHPLLLIGGNAAQAGGSFMGQLALFLNSDDILFAAIALLLFVAIVASSITIARRRWKYESWYVVHLAAYAAVFLALPHQIEFGTDLLASTFFYGYWISLYIIVFTSHIFFRLTRPFLLLRRHRFTVERIERESHNVISLYITGRALGRFRISPGQFMILRFLAKGYRWQAHPFSLSMVPDGSRLRVTVKELGDFTRTIARVPVGAPVLIDGPYGVFTDLFGLAPKALLIAGGIGITPIRALFEEMLGKGKDAVLLYANHAARDVVFKDELETVAARLNARIVHVLSGEASPGAEHGHIDEGMIHRLVPDAAEREVYLCGPVPMIDALLPVLRRLGIPPARIHAERFSL